MRGVSTPPPAPLLLRFLLQGASQAPPSPAQDSFSFPGPGIWIRRARSPHSPASTSKGGLTLLPPVEKREDSKSNPSVWDLSIELDFGPGVRLLRLELLQVSRSRSVSICSYPQPHQGLRLCLLGADLACCPVRWLGGCQALPLTALSWRGQARGGERGVRGS